MNTVLIMFALLSNGNYEPLFVVPFKTQEECEQQRTLVQTKTACVPKMSISHSKKKG